VVRPLRDSAPAAPEPVGGYITPAELAAVRAAFEPLASLEAEQREVNTQAGEARGSFEAADRATLPALAERAEVLKASHEKLRGSARLAVLATLDAAALRAGTEYSAACRIVADAAAKLEGLARLRDELVNVGPWAGFDPLGTWARGNALLAPVALTLRPRGWAVTSDVYGRDCYWSPGSASHTDALRQTQQAFRGELDKALSGAVWPF
jgi:hypothetical protein